jgi:hypothetical protein
VCFSTESSPSPLPLYEYHGFKRLRFLRDGLAPIAAYFSAKAYLNAEPLIDHLTGGSLMSLAEYSIMSVVLFGHYAYLQRLVSALTVNSSTQTVDVQVFNVLGRYGVLETVRYWRGFTDKPLRIKTDIFHGKKVLNRVAQQPLYRPSCLTCRPVTNNCSFDQLFSSND